jgi:hypothetical protein
MSDYTPTTEEISIGWAWYKSGWIHSDEIQPQFDRWVAEIKAEAVAQFIDDTGISLDAAQSLMAKAWEEGLEAKFKLLEGQHSVSLDNPYRQEQKIILSNNDYDQLRKALDEE